MSTPPRIEPLPESEWDPEVSALLRRRGRQLDRDRNIRATLIRHRRLFDKWGPLAVFLMRQGSLEAADRELVILRVAWRCECSYEWGQHAELGTAHGLTDDQLQELVTDQPGASLSAEQLVLVAAVDELVAKHTVGDVVWQRLVGWLDENQLIELPFLVGHYAMVAGALRAPGVADEPAAPRFPAVSGDRT